MTNILNNIKKRIFYLIIFTMLIALMMGYFFNLSILKSMISFVLFIMIYPMMINLDIIDVLKGIRNVKPIVLAMFINFLISPLIIYILKLLFVNISNEIFIGILLIALIPTSGMTASWTGIAEGDIKLSLIIMSSNLLLSIILVPVYLKLFIGNSINLPTILIIKSLIKVVIIPLILGDLTRRFLYRIYGVEKFKKIKPLFSGISSIGLILIVFIAMSLKSKMIISNLEIVFISIIPIIIYYLIMLLTSESLGKILLCYEENISLVYGTSLRNLTIALAIAISSLNDTFIVLAITIAYMVQIPIGSLYLKYLKLKKSSSNLIQSRC